LTSLLTLYEDMRKKRTEVNVAGAVLTQKLYHTEDGEERVPRGQGTLSGGGDKMARGIQVEFGQTQLTG
jgi:hypothetical protein